MADCNNNIKLERERFKDYFPWRPCEVLFRGRTCPVALNKMCGSNEQICYVDFTSL